MTFPHPETGEKHHGKEHVAGRGRVVRKHLERAVDVADDRNGADEVDPAEDGTFGGLCHVGLCSQSIRVRVCSRFAKNCSQPWRAPPKAWRWSGRKPDC